MSTPIDEPDLHLRLQAALGDTYTVRRAIGRGTFGSVYEVEDQPLRRLLAVKVLHHMEPDSVARFQREAVILANLHHPNIVPLHFVGSAQGLLFIVMPRLQGLDLRKAMGHSGPMELQEIAAITPQVSSALDAAHAANVVHRDVKPENVFLEGAGRRVQLTDFGVAKVIEGRPAEGVAIGTIIGTAEYMSPEQCSGVAIDGRSDVYSLGCVVYEMLVGTPPFTGRWHQEILQKHISCEPPRLRSRRPNLSRAAEDCVLRALSKSPSDRFPTASAFAQSLSDTSAEGAIRAKWWRLWH